MKTASYLVLAVLTAHFAFAEGEDMRSKIGSVLRDDAKAYTKKEQTEPQANADAKDAKDQAAKPAEKAVTMPRYKVQARPFAKESEATVDAKVKVKGYDKQIAREEAASKTTEQDAILNNKKTSIMGPLSAGARSQDAKNRVRELEIKKEVAGTIVDPSDDKENKELLDELNDLEYQKKYR